MRQLFQCRAHMPDSLDDEYRSSRNIAISLFRRYRNVVDRGGGGNLKEFINAGVNAYALGCTGEGLREELRDMKDSGVEIEGMQTYSGSTSLKFKILSTEDVTGRGSAQGDRQNKLSYVLLEDGSDQNVFPRAIIWTYKVLDSSRGAVKLSFVPLREFLFGMSKLFAEAQRPSALLVLVPDQGNDFAPVWMLCPERLKMELFWEIVGPRGRDVKGDAPKLILLAGDAVKISEDNPGDGDIRGQLTNSVPVEECILWLSIIFITILCTPQPTIVRWSSTPPVSEEVMLQWKGFCALIANAYYIKGMAWLPVKTLQLEQMAVVGSAEEPSVVSSRMRLVFSTLEVVSPQWPRV
ncbi:hypothetical protein GIB67_026986 [Kingdonia uniflora]|uniref:DUF7876 domain-containing protein n=1 Tax=Kingdonia uniflora TaxID=39325 RepID=A0A7J7P1I8_9MAGN|nr:hypothetical protein GIB67_026986 [Kingdonia uniflora]